MSSVEFACADIPVCEKGCFNDMWSRWYLFSVMGHRTPS